MASQLKKTPAAKAYRKILVQHNKVLAALDKTKAASKAAEKEAKKLAQMVDTFPTINREYYEEALKTSIDMLQTKFGML